jgi:hypothetical protein
MLLAKKLWAIIYIIVCLVLTMLSMVAAQAATPTNPPVDFQDPSDIQAVVELEDGYTEANLYEKLDPLTKAENFEIASSGFPVTRPNPSNLTIVDIPEDRVFDRIEDLEKLPGVKSAQLNIPYFPATYTPDDAAFGSQWYLDDTNSANIGAQAAWSEVGSILNGSPVTCSESTPVCGGDENVVVAVIDTGVNQNITEFTGVNFVNPAAFEYKVNPCSGGEVDVLGKQTSLGYMCKLPTQNDDCVTSSGSTLSSCGHGTQVASVIAMQDNASDGIGIAYNVSIMPISIKGAFNTIGVAKAIEHAKDNGADVINMSLAAIANDPTVETEINEAYNAGVTIVAASGNCGNSFIGGSGCFPSVTPSSPWYNYGGTNPVIYPAYYDNVISVGALEGNNTRSLYSTYNSRLDISAPVGSGVYTIYRDGTPVQTTTTIDGKSVNGIGTSFAAPQVAAAAALMKSVDSTARPSDINSALMRTSSAINGIANNQVGAGRLNVCRLVGGCGGDTFSSKYYFTWNDTRNGNNAWNLVYNLESSEQRASVEVKDLSGSNEKLGDLFYVGASSIITPSFRNQVGGYIEIASEGSADFVTSQRVLFGSSFNEFAGIPASSLTNEYYFTWNDTTNGNQAWTLIANPEDAAGSVDVDLIIGGVTRATNTLAPGQIWTPQITNLRAGPVKVEATGNVIATQRVLFGSSFNEFAGIPASSLTNEYYFTWNDTTNGNQAWTLIANPEDAAGSVDVDLIIGGVTRATNTLAPGQIWTPQITNLRAGPVKVEATGNVIATQRVLFGSSFNEFAGIPASSLTNEYYFTWNDTSSGGNSTWNLIGNPSGSQTANVTVSVAGVNVGSYSIPPGGIIFPSFSSTTGPVFISSNINVFASQRLLTANGSFNEYAGIPR